MQVPAPMSSAIATLLLKVQKEVSKLDFPKTTSNPHFKSKYCPLDVVIEKVLPALHKNGFVLMQPVTTLDGPDGPQGALTTMLVHETGEVIEYTMLLMPLKANPQNQGSAITYARRYSLQSLLGITPEDDVDGANTGGGGVDPLATVTATEAAAIVGAGHSAPAPF